MKQGKGSGSGKEAGMSRRTMALILLGLAALAMVLVFLLLAGCTAPASETRPAVTPAPVPSFMMHVAGSKDRGIVLLVGRTTCPWCMKAKELLGNLGVDYYWIDLNTLDEANTTRVTDAIRVCGQTNSVPILVINGERCIVGYQEDQIRGALG
jgi:glutaredoxin